MELLTHSRLATNRLCQRKHDLTYNQGYRPVATSDALRFGTLVHAGLAAFWSGTDIDAALAGEADEFERVKAEELLRGYTHRYDRNEFEVVAVEAQFDAPLLNPETLAPSKTFRLAGKLDAIVKDRESGRVAVMEHKTATTIDEDYWAKLQMDSQVTIYVLGAEALGYEVSDTIYDVIKKVGLRPYKATPVDARKYTKDGRLYAAQHENDETPDEYRVRVRVDIAAAPAEYFQRRLIPRMNSQVQDAMYDFWQTGRQIRESQIANRAPRNPDACFQYGQRCAFWSVCTGGLEPAEHPELFRKAETAHEELA